MGDWTDLVIEVLDSNKIYDAKYTDSKVMVDGKQVQFEAYNIADNNYFKLRDLCKLFDFDVSWDGANNCVLIDSTSSYTED